MYVLQRGEKNDGQVLVKVSDCSGQAALFIRQRDLMSNELIWVDAIQSQTESDADAYITRARDRDLDLWVIEVEDTSLENPFA